MPHASGPRRWHSALILAMAFFFCGPVAAAVPVGWAAERLYALNLYGGRLTSNHWGDFLELGEGLDFKDSYLVAATIARCVGTYRDKASFEIEGQIVKHFNIQTHWELNALVAARWEAFWWDDVLDTSVAFGLGPSYAMDEPEIELEYKGDTSRFLIYWMGEIAVVLPDYDRAALIVRIHHRSNAYGLIADEGVSNSLALGLKWRF